MAPYPQSAPQQGLMMESGALCIFLPWDEHLKHLGPVGGDADLLPGLLFWFSASDPVPDAPF